MEKEKTSRTCHGRFGRCFFFFSFFLSRVSKYFTLSPRCTTDRGLPQLQLPSRHPPLRFILHRVLASRSAHRTTQFSFPVYKRVTTTVKVIQNDERVFWSFSDASRSSRGGKGRGSSSNPLHTMEVDTAVRRPPLLNTGVETRPLIRTQKDPSLFPSTPPRTTPSPCAWNKNGVHIFIGAVEWRSNSRATARYAR